MIKVIGKYINLFLNKKIGGFMAKKLKEPEKEVSLKDHQGVAVFKGSGYNGKGGVDKSKIRSNKKRKS